VNCFVKRDNCIKICERILKEEMRTIPLAEGKSMIDSFLEKEGFDPKKTDQIITMTRKYTFIQKEDQ